MPLHDAYKRGEYISCLRKYYELQMAGKEPRFCDLPHFNLLKASLGVRNENAKISRLSMMRVFEEAMERKWLDDAADKDLIEYFTKISKKYHENLP
jgi:hypothetical protein